MVLPAFNTQLTNDFLADAQPVDFSNPSAIAAVNTWTSQRTHARITDAVHAGDLTVETSILLTNVLYFKGDWDIPFKKADTAEGDFFPAPDRKVRAMLMSQRKEHQ